jgi:hypothetical protein
MICYPWTVTWQLQGIDLDEFKYFKRWFEELSARPAVIKGLAVAPVGPGRGPGQPQPGGTGPTAQAALQPARPARSGFLEAGWQLMAETLPIIDMASLFAAGAGRERVAAEIATACEAHGFFYLVGHGVTPDVLRDLEARAAPSSPGRFPRSWPSPWTRVAGRGAAIFRWAAS